jgi:hypothetical protein
MDEIYRVYCKKENKAKIHGQIKTLPCKGCILLAICKGQEEIRCDVLWNILREFAFTKEGEVTEILDLVQGMFPNSKEIFQYTISDNPHVSFRWKDPDEKW